MMQQQSKTQRPKFRRPEKTGWKPRALITVQQRAAIRGRSLVDERVVARWAAGGPVRPSTETRIERACRELGIEVLA